MHQNIIERLLNLIAGISYESTSLMCLYEPEVPEAMKKQKQVH